MTDRTLSTVQRTGDTATVRVEDVLGADLDAVWAALTEPGLLRGWLATVDGDLVAGGEIALRFTSSWQGTGRIEVCEAPSRLVVTTWEEDGTRTELEARLTVSGAGTALVITDSGLPAGEAWAHAAGWQVHVEDLAALLAGRPVSDWQERWTELSDRYRPQADR